MTDLDFNDAPTQDAQPPPFQTNIDREIHKENVKQAVMNRLESFLGLLFPAGYIQGNEFRVGSIDGEEGHSLGVHLKGSKRGVWTDFAGEKGGDVFTLVQKAKKCGFKESLEYCEAFTGISGISSPKTGKIPPKKKEDPLPPPSHTYRYPDVDGSLIGLQWRFDLGTNGNGKPQKEFRPFDVKRQKKTFPDPRPLYNLPTLVKVNGTAFVEGEKCADALMSIGIPATTLMGGANAPVDKHDLSILAGKEIVIWPDNDDAGMVYANNVREALEKIGCKVRILVPPADKPKGWDAADALAEGFDIREFLFGGVAQEKPKKHDISLFKTSSAYVGEIPERRFLINNTIPMAAVTLFAAMGGAGKGMLMLDLAIKVSCPCHTATFMDPKPKAFGNDIEETGTAVIISAEDDQDEVHRRLAAIDPTFSWRSEKSNLYVMPLPNSGGPMPLITNSTNGPVSTPDFEYIKNQLIQIPDLKLIIFDPLSSFLMADVVKDQVAASYMASLFAYLGTETGAAVIVTHHMNKVAGDKPISTIEQARAAIRGSTALIDGVRLAYAMWQMETNQAQKVCRKLERRWEPGAVFSSAVVKVNGPADKTIKTLVRNESNGLLEVMDDTLKAIEPTKQEILELLVENVKKAAENGRPFVKIGTAGIYERREELPLELRGLGRDRIRAYTQELLDAGVIFKCIAKGSSNPKWLDVEGGDFKAGCGEFCHGFNTGDDAEMSGAPF